MNLLGTKARKIIINKFDWPRCGKCNMPVEDFQLYDTGTEILVLAICHRASDLSILTAEDLLNPVGYIRMGQAFADLS